MPQQYWRRFLWVVVSAVVMACGSGGEPSKTVEHPPPICGEQSPVYIWVYAHHYVGGGGVYPRGQDIRDVVSVVDDVDVPATFFFDGILIEELVHNDPGVFNRLVGNPRVSFGYHGEETHGPFPVPVSASNAEHSMTYLEDWDAAVAKTIEYATSARNYSFIDADAAIRSIDPLEPWVYKDGQSGAVALVRSVLGDDLAAATYHGLASPPVQHAFRSVWEPTLQQATYPMESHALPNDVPASVVNQLFDLGGSHDLIVHAGALTTKERPELDLPRGQTALQNALAGLDRSRPRLLMYRMIVEPGNSTELYADITYLKDTFLPANPGSRFVTPDALPAMVEGLYGLTLSAPNVATLAQQVQAGFATGRPPDTLEVDGMWVSLADAYELLALALRGYGTTGAFPETVSTTNVQGPIGAGASIAHCGKRTLTVGDVVPVAVASLEAIDASKSDVRPRRVPYVMDVAELECNVAEVLLAMARSVTILDAGGTVETEVVVEEVGVIPPMGDAFDAVMLGPSAANPLWLSKLQLWSVRAAPFRCE